MAGVTIPRGELVVAVIASANRHERQFDNPDELDLSREPNKHLSFGLGAHYCLGASLARLERQIAVDSLLRRIPDLRLAVAPESLRWRRGMVVRGLLALPVAFARRGSTSRKSFGLFRRWGKSGTRKQPAPPATGTPQSVAADRS